ncbi:MAG TPA: hypothetical protein VGF45_17295, partial [Polyangia bacterium]
MDRRLSPETLIDYHFGTLEGPERAAVEEALLSSEESLRTYLRLKRELDGAYPAEDVPSASAKERLRLAVASEVEKLRHPPRSRLRAWLSRPVPLYQTVAVAAVVALLAGVLGGFRPVRDDLPLTP